MATAAIYARYSSAGQREESIEDQVRVCRAAIEAAGDAVGHVYEDRATTGTTTDRRAGFMRMVADAQKGLFSAVYVYKLDRFARNRYDAAVYRHRLKQAGVRLVSATERTGDGPDGILLESMLEGLAEYYSANLSENVRRGLAGNAMKCRHNGIRVFGYDHGPDGRYVVDEGEAAAVRRVFAMYQQGEPFRAIIEALPAVRSKGGGPLTVQAVGKMLRNDKYAGVYRYGDTVVEGGMPQIIPREEFDAVQRRLALRTRRRRSTVDYLLSGKLFDSEGHRYQSSSGHGKSGRKYTYYRCPATGHQVRRDALEAKVARMVADALAADDGAVEGIVADVMAEQEAALADDLAAVRAMEKRLQQNAREQSRMVDLAAKTGAVDAVAEKLNARQTSGRRWRPRSPTRGPAWGRSTPTRWSSGCGASWGAPTRWRPCGCSCAAWWWTAPPARSPRSSRSTKRNPRRTVPAGVRVSIWGLGRRDSNPQQPAPKTGVLPLNYVPMCGVAQKQLV